MVFLSFVPSGVQVPTSLLWRSCVDESMGHVKGTRGVIGDLTHVLLTCLTTESGTVVDPRTVFKS